MTSPLAITRNWGVTFVAVRKPRQAVQFIQQLPTHWTSEDEQAWREWSSLYRCAIRAELLAEETEKARCCNNGPKRHGVRAMTDDDYTQMTLEGKPDAMG